MTERVIGEGMAMVGPNREEIEQAEELRLFGPQPAPEDYRIANRPSRIRALGAERVMREFFLGADGSKYEAKRLPQHKDVAKWKYCPICGQKLYEGHSAENKAWEIDECLGKVEEQRA